MVSITIMHHLGNTTVNHPPVQTEPHVHVDPHSTLFLWYIFIIVGLVLLGGVFSGLTLGLMGLDTVNLQVLAISGTPDERRQAPRVLKLIGKGKHTMLVVLLLGNTLINTSLPIFLDSIVGGGLIAVLGSTLLILIFGEILPQSICDRYGLAIGSTFTPLIKVLIILMYPIAKPMGMILDYILGAHSDPVTYRKAELKTFVSLGVEDKLNEDELGLLGSVLEFSNKKVGDVMTAKEDMYTLSSDKIVDGELVSEVQILRKGYSRIPVYDSRTSTYTLRSLVSYDPTDLLPASRLIAQVLPQCSPDLPLLEAMAYFQRNCIHIEFDLTGSGRTDGDHVVLFNPDVEVDRMLSVLGLDSGDKRFNIIDIESLDPALAKVPFPTPATYDAIFRHYLDISAIASRQTIAFLSRYAPTDSAKEKLSAWGTNKELYAKEIDGPALKLAEVLQAASGDSLDPIDGNNFTSTRWHIPSVVRCKCKYTAASPVHHHEPRWVFGLSTNFILNVKHAHSGANTPAAEQDNALEAVTMRKVPSYKLSGPRDNYVRENVYKVPIHVRRSTFRLPTSPKVPIIMIGPGTGVAPFRGFVQERIALARKAIEKNGPDALKDWAPMYLFYGCRKSNEDFLYKDEWPEYERELKGVFRMKVAFSREMRKPDGSKVYVQDLIHDLRSELAPLIVDKRAYIYICGDAKSMSKAVEERLTQMLGEAKGGSAEVEGVKELKMLKERNRLMTDVWS
ncbi:hypothetical protein I302_100643 [Kwoniella bestiolae CBS 10118]|uniref:CNNM transmembrane domain-containing protein n=1 Tax=Kwoniella bestiolae CBS 10118 TaxID=1296100 RepID=A0AAJ8M3Y7_9TREE